MKNIILFFYFLNVSAVYSQVSTTIPLNFKPTFGEEVLKKDKAHSFGPGKDSISVSKLKLYISNVELYRNDKLVYAKKKKNTLISFDEASTLNDFISLPKKLKYNQIQFNIGIDSTTNVSGAFGGDLDPTKGMYWTWQSGYINFKLEGYSPICSSRNNAFSIHIGGYQAPYYAIRTVRFPIKKKEAINIEIDLEKLFQQIDFRNNYEVMSPNKKAMKIADQLPLIFSISK